jgi:signal transduction histidine kinase
VRRLELMAHPFAHALARKQAALGLMESERRNQAAPDPRKSADAPCDAAAGNASDEDARLSGIRQSEAEGMAQELCGRLIKSQDEHRAMLARELHDDVTQRIAQIAMDVARFTHQASLSEAEEKLMRGAGDALVRLSRDVHALSYNLHPSLLIEMGLEEALNEECGKFSQRKSIAVELRLRQLPGTIVRDTAVAIFRILQEALNNAARHGRASNIEVRLRGVNGGLELVIRDDGVGFDPSWKRSTPSLGLASMRERARMLNGMFAIESQPGRGTSITSWMPN